MKKKHERLTTALWITGFIPMAITLLVLPFMPDRIPAHYDFQMNITRWGSKYESLIYPIFTILMAAFMYAMSCYAGKQENGNSNKKVILISGIAINFLFLAIHGYSLVKDITVPESELNAGTWDGAALIRLVFILTGITTAIIGNFIPKCKLNSLIGLRTKWSMADEDVWFKCQRFGGVLLIVLGLMMALLTAVIKSISLVIMVNLIAVTIALFLAVLGSRFIYQNKE